MNQRRRLIVSHSLFIIWKISNKLLDKLPLLELPHKPGQRAVLLKDDEIRKYVENIQDIPEADTAELDILELVEKQLRASFVSYIN